MYKAIPLNKVLVITASMLLLQSLSANATVITGRVVGIADGDTLTILDANNNQYKTRLAEIDAPEKKQSFGNNSKQNLSSLCYGKQATITTSKNDQYNRVIGYVNCDGINANKHQVQTGMAWAYKQYVKDPEFYRLEIDAKTNKRGLWVDSNPIEPWKFRKQAKQH